MQKPASLRRIVTDRIYDREGIFCIEIAGERINKVFGVSEADARQLAKEEGVLDCRGLLVLPGFVDSHVHLIGTALYELAVDLLDVTSLEEILARLKSFSERYDYEFIIAGKLNTANLPENEREGLKAFLDEKFDRPLFIRSIEHHSGFLNSLAWEKLEIDRLASELGVKKTELARMHKSGRIVGKLYENVAEKSYDFFSEEERKKMVTRFLKGLSQKGLTAIHCLEGYGREPEIDFRVINEVSSLSEGIDLILYPRTTEVALAKRYAGSRLGGCILIDGAVGARTASFSFPYADAKEGGSGACGILYFRDDEVRRLVLSAAKARLQLCVHAIGDCAIEQMISACEDVAGEIGIGEFAGLRFRIDHFCAGNPAHFERAQKLGICASMQPAFDFYFGGEEGTYAKALGKERALKMNPLKTAIESGIKIGGGSDSPITPLSPALGIYSACNHNNEQERLSFVNAIRIFTEGSAYLAFEEKVRGKIDAGYLADIVVLPGETNSTNIKEQSPIFTIKGGKIRYQREDAKI